MFLNLTTEENLIATAANRRGDPMPWTLKRIYDMFPSLEARRTSMGTLCQAVNSKCWRSAGRSGRTRVS